MITIRPFENLRQPNSDKLLLNLQQLTLDLLQNRNVQFQSMSQLFSILTRLNKFEQVKMQLRSLLLNESIRIKSEIDGLGGNPVEFILQSFHLYKKKLILLSQIFSSVSDKKFVIKLGLNQFLTTLTPNLVSLKLVVIDMLNSYRIDGNNLEILKTAVGMYQDLEIYHDLEVSILRQTAEFYAPKTCETIQKYIDFCNETIAKELKICDDGILPMSIKKPLLAVVEDVLIRDKLQYILSCFKYLVLGNNFELAMEVDNGENNEIKNLNVDFEYLEKMYNLLDMVGLAAIQTKQLDGKETNEPTTVDLISSNSLKSVFAQWIVEHGSTIVLDESKDATMIPSLLKFYQTMVAIVRDSFDNSEIFKQTLKESFEQFINKRQTKPSEYMAMYIDKVLKKGVVQDDLSPLARNADERLDQTLDDCINIFRLLQGKDVFEAFYGKSLAKRLLLSKSASVDAEKSMLQKLKSECGPMFTQKLDGMFKDMDISKELSEGFHKTPKYASQLGSDVEFNVNVLTVAHWPTYPVLELNLPPEFSSYQQTWLDYYSSKHSGRKITWALSIGHCLVHYLHPKGNKDLVLSLYQTIVLLLFNDKESMTAEEIQKSTNLDNSDLERTIQSLSLGKVKILKKKPHTRNVALTDVLSINPDFTHASRRIVVNSIQASETQKEVTQTTEKVFEDRIPAIEACIVRIMKGKKTCSFKALVAEVFEAMKFPMEINDLKKRIENLVERDFLERDEKDPSMFIYVS